MNKNKSSLKASITEDVLRIQSIIKESLEAPVTAGIDTLEALEDKMEEIDARYLELDEKKWESLKKDEEKATAEENFATLITIRQDIAKTVSKLMAAYKKKLEYLTKYHALLQDKNKESTSKGSKVFSNKEINEFKNEDFKKDGSVQLNTNTYTLKVKKVSDSTNQWFVLSSTIPGVMEQDVIALPAEIKIGGSAAIKVYRKIGDRHNEIASPTLENITKIVKSPV